MRKVLLIVNPRSGKMAARSKLFDIVNTFCKNQDDVTVKITQKRLDATEFAKNAEGYDLVVCVGGDGTLNEVINGVMQLEKRVPIGYIPAGSTNDFAETLSLNKNIKQATMEAVVGEPYKIDIGKFGERYFCYVASFGAFTKSSYQTDQSLKNTLGHFAYLLQGAGEIVDIKNYFVKITADGVDKSGDYIFGAITNTTSMGGVINLHKKNVKLDDGLFEVILIKRPAPMEIGQTVAAILSQSFQSPCIEFFTAKTLHVDGGEKFNWSLDGEHVKTNGLVKIENKQRQIEIILK